MTMQAEAQRIYTPEDYLELEVNSDIRHEYRNGEIIPMTGGAPNHNDIAGNLYILLKSHLSAKEYRTFYADQRLWIPNASLYTYPDVMVLSKPLEFQIGRKDTVMNPCLIAEVLSKSTQNYDRSEKFVSYRMIPSFREYLLIDQYQFYVEHYVKTADHQWLLTEYNDPTTTITLTTLEIQIQITDLHDNIDFDDT